MGGQQEALAEHDVDLAAHQLADIVEPEHDHVQRATSQLDLRALVALGNVLDDERVQPEQIAQLAEQVSTGVDEI